MTFKITVAEKKAILRRRKVKALYPDDPDALLDPITKEDLITAVISNNAKRDKTAIKKEFEAMLKETISNARYVLKHSISDIESDIAKRVSTF